MESDAQMTLNCLTQKVFHFFIFLFSFQTLKTDKIRQKVPVVKKTMFLSENSIWVASVDNGSKEWPIEGDSRFHFFVFSCFLHF